MHRFVASFSMVILVALLFFPICSYSSVEHSNSFYDMGVYAFEEKKYKQAEKYFLKAIQKNPANKFCHYYLGKICFKMSRYLEAESYFNITWKNNQHTPGLKYDIALLKFKMFDFKKASVLFKEIALNNPEDIMASYYAGMSLFRQSKYVKALDYFIDASNQNLSIKDNGLYYAGICLKKIGRFDQAMEKFEYVYNNAKSELLKKSARKQIESVREKKNYKPYQLHLELGAGYNDNVSLSSLDSDINADGGDMFVDAYLFANYNFFNNRHYKAGAGFAHYQSWHNQLDDYDITGSLFNFYFLKPFNKFAVGIKYTPSLYKVGGSKFLTRHTITPMFTYNINENLTTALFYDFSDNKYDQNSGRDGNTNEFSAQVSYSVLNKDINLSARIGYEDTSTADSDFCYTRIKTRAGIFFKLPLDIDVEITGNLKMKNYKKSHSYYDKKRKDTWYSGKIVLSRSVFYEWLNLSAKLGYEENNSNINDFTYKKNITGLSMSADF